MIRIFATILKFRGETINFVDAEMWTSVAVIEVLVKPGLR